MRVNVGLMLGLAVLLGFLLGVLAIPWVRSSSSQISAASAAQISESPPTAAVCLTHPEIDPNASYMALRNTFGENALLIQDLGEEESSFLLPYDDSFGTNEASLLGAMGSVVDEDEEDLVKSRLAINKVGGDPLSVLDVRQICWNNAH